MMIGLLKLPVLIAAIGAFVIGGVFYGFSTFIMQALARVPGPEGIRAMQAINITVINPFFIGLFIGTALLLLGLAVVAGLNFGQPGAIHVLAGAALWARYLRDWVFWNHVRTAAALAGAVVLVLGWAQAR